MGGLVVPALPLSQSAVYTYALRAIAQLDSLLYGLYAPDQARNNGGRAAAL